MNVYGVFITPIIHPNIGIYISIYTLCTTAIEFRIPSDVRSPSHLYAPPRFVRFISDALSPKPLFRKYYCTMYVYVCKVDGYRHSSRHRQTHTTVPHTIPIGYLYRKPAAGRFVFNMSPALLQQYNVPTSCNHCM